MSRITDALRRAQTGSAAGPIAEEARDSAPIQFFAPGRPAVVSPWDIRTEPAEPPVVPEPPRRVPRDDRTRSFHSRLADHTPERVQWPSGESAEKLVVSRDTSALARVQYSKLAASLHQIQLERGVKVLLTTSASAGEGKTLTIVNVALTFAEAYHRRVLVIDADLRASMVHELFGISNQQGLSDLLAVDGPLTVVDVSPLLSVLPAGQGQGDPMKTLTSDRMRALLEDARADYDWILLDTPPVGLMPDAKSLASMSDGALLIAQAASTPYDQIQRAVAAFDQGFLLGVVLNRVAGRAWPRAYLDAYYEGRDR